MTRILLAELSCRKVRGEYAVSMRPQYGESVSMRCDGNLGTIMTGLVTLFEAITVMQHGGAMRPRVVTSSPVNLTTFCIEPLLIRPFVWRLVMSSGSEFYGANLDRDLEGVMMAFMGAMKVFGFKCGLTTFDTEVIRNRDRAGEAGLLTQEDFHA